MHRPASICNFSLLFLSGILLCIAVVLAGANEAHARDITVSASLSSRSMEVGDQITLDVEIQSPEPRSVSRPELPELDGLRYVSTVPKTSTNYSMIGGTATMVYKYSYTVQAAESGSFQIPAIYVEVDGREYSSRPFTVSVQGTGERPAQQTTPSRAERRPVFLELELSEEQPVRGQQIVADIVLYFRNSVEITSFQVARSWQTEGFWREDLSQSELRRPETVVLDGSQYRRAVVSRYALFPTRSGELNIPSYGIDARVRILGRFRDEYSTFFDGSGRQRSVNLETEPRTLSVSTPPIPPSDGQLISALGRFSIDRTLSSERVKLGESVEVITEIEGTGNLGLITRPRYSYPGVFDTHRPREVIDRDKNAPEMTGTKQYRDVLIARRTGTFTIPETTIQVYNDARRRYEPHVLPELVVEVVRDPNARVSIARSDDFRLTPIRGSVTWSDGTHRPFYQLWWFWFALAIPLGLFFYGFRAWKYQSRLSTDETFSRQERAFERAMDHLESAESLADTKEVYSLIDNALYGYIADRLGLPSAGLSEDQLVAALQKRNVEGPLLRKVSSLLKKCATVRYLPEPSAMDMVSDLAEARNIIRQLDPQL
ncbi:BatD family protein [Natronogracilivirga saccharolytica]|uniref:Protein BatD n=1 Tax=Natronogracilivirga saccharolytica TaxID=2812953 RepID=A0A8J7RMD1_9BACT|nr:BatD family protein [Natronogracilivirga saccharolytica]MBP3193575.1 protein BatD [Natronogracilivirga saccharolytica]